MMLKYNKMIKKMMNKIMMRKKKKKNKRKMEKNISLFNLMKYLIL